ncbi:hypothetical protein C5E45_16295 [Nocardia nova]|uniref:Tyr recombinase domain-containing protein n=1 Tax=Nocardia nova TaxID=37330 RepID=A0A2S6APS9_9NOCA|nr:hypothetical protein [Nocardia nova]PPJ27840.1 hypothetical protein C5E41_14550 [Nocardia nova]PPJ37209.1 hypothetical protein C5E45_16295 [Nocardia nova]
MCLPIGNVTHPAGRVGLRLGRQSLITPDSLDGLLIELVATRRGKASLDLDGDRNRWLFPGGLPGTAIHPTTLAARLRRLGVPSRTGRNTALADHAAVLPAKVLSDLLGLSVTAAIRWGKLADISGDTCAAGLTRRRAAKPTSQQPQMVQD